MRRLTLVGMAILAVVAFAAISAGAAMAEEPALLVLPGEKISELKYEGKAGESKLETVNGKTIVCKKAKATSTFTALTGKEADSEAGTGTVDFEECKKEAVACRSEAGGVKDPIETILTPLALTAANEESTTKTLQSLLVNTLSATLIINCGGVKEEVKGSVGCLASPALSEVAAGGAVKIVCLGEKGKQVTGKCLASVATCEKLAKGPLEANLGAGFEGASETISLEGSFNKMTTIDD